MIAETITYEDTPYGSVTIPKGDITIRPCVEKKLVWENYNVELFKQYITPDTVAIDAGAYVGLHAMKMAQIHPKVDVIAIEMMPLHFQCVQSNIYNNRIGNITPIHCCLTDRRNKYELLPKVDYTKNNNLGGTALYFDRTEMRVECRTLDDISAEFRKRVSFIKMDIEGHEIQALEGARVLIATHRPVILVEVWKGQMERFRESNIFKYICNLGYAFRPHKADDHLFLPQ